MGKTIDIAGQRYGRLVVVKPAGRFNSGEIRWECLCDCGAVKIIGRRALRSRNTVSCGCHRREVTSEAVKRHYERNKEKVRSKIFQAPYEEGYWDK